MAEHHTEHLLTEFQCQNTTSKAQHKLLVILSGKSIDATSGINLMPSVSKLLIMDEKRLGVNDRK